MLMSECSFVDRDMFMRYLGGGIGHVAIATQPEEENIEENVNIILTNTHEATTGTQVSELNERLVLEELRRAASIIAGGGTANDREEAEPDDQDTDSDTDSEDEGMDDGMSMDSDDQESDDDLGPEDGEDEGYLDSGYSAL